MFFKKKKEELPQQQIPLELKPREEPSFASSQQIQDISLEKRLEILESKIENLKIYLEMINSKLDRLEALLRAKGLV